MPDLTKRVERLETENRWLKRLGLLAVIVLVAGAAGNQYSEIRTENLVLVDNGNKERARLATLPDGTATLSFRNARGQIDFLLLQGKETAEMLFYDSPGKARLNLGVSEKGPAVKLMDNEEKMRVDLTVLPTGSPGLTLMDAKDQRNAVFMMSDKGDSTLIFTENDNLQASLAVVDGFPSLNLYSKNKSIATLGLTDARIAELSLKGEDGKVVFQAPAK